MWFVVVEKGEELRRVESILMAAGVTSLLVKKDMGDLVIYYISREQLKRDCNYDECSNASKGSTRMCVEECIVRKGTEIAKRVASAIREVMAGKRFSRNGY